MNGITVTQRSIFEADASRKELRNGEPRPQVPRVSLVSRLMALAIRFDQLIRDGVVADQSELARLAHVTQPRMT